MNKGTNPESLQNLDLPSNKLKTIDSIRDDN